MRFPDVLLPGARLSVAELSAARIDGVLTELGEGYIAADDIDDARHRAASLRTVLPSGFVAFGPSAAWVHGAGAAPPTRHHLQSAGHRRGRLPRGLTARLHDSAAPADAQERIGDVVVTSIVRTFQDLALGIGRESDFRRWTHLLAQTHPDALPAAIEALRSRARVPGKRAALELLEGYAGQDEVTRYTS